MRPQKRRNSLSLEACCSFCSRDGFVKIIRAMAQRKFYQDCADTGWVILIPNDKKTWKERKEIERIKAEVRDATRQMTKDKTRGVGPKPPSTPQAKS